MTKTKDSPSKEKEAFRKKWYNGLDIKVDDITYAELLDKLKVHYESVSPGSRESIRFSVAHYDTHYNEISRLRMEWTEVESDEALDKRWNEYKKKVAEEAKRKKALQEEKDRLEYERLKKKFKSTN